MRRHALSRSINQQQGLAVSFVRSDLKESGDPVEREDREESGDPEVRGDLVKSEGLVKSDDPAESGDPVEEGAPAVDNAPVNVVVGILGGQPTNRLQMDTINFRSRESFCRPSLGIANNPPKRSRIPRVYPRLSYVFCHNGPGPDNGTITDLYRQDSRA